MSRHPCSTDIFDYGYKINHRLAGIGLLYVFRLRDFSFSPGGRVELPAVAVAIATVGSTRLEPRASPAWDSSGNTLVHIMASLNSRIVNLFGLVHCQCNRICLSWVLIEA